MNNNQRSMSDENLWSNQENCYFSYPSQLITYPDPVTSTLIYLYNKINVHAYKTYWTK